MRFPHRRNHKYQEPQHHKLHGFKDIVDAIGGVTVDNRIDFTLEGVHLSKGKQHLDGKTALTYAPKRICRLFLNAFIRPIKQGREEKAGLASGLRSSKTSSKIGRAHV